MRDLIDLMKRLDEAAEILPFPARRVGIRPVPKQDVPGTVHHLPTRNRTPPLDDFTRGYIEHALWTESDPDGVPLAHGQTLDDIDRTTLQTMIDDCRDFQSAGADLLGAAYDTGRYSPKQAGGDFWLTRNRHGAGFWDKGLPTGKALSDLAKPYGSFSLYFGDDDRIYGQ